MKFIVLGKKAMHTSSSLKDKKMASYCGLTRNQLAVEVALKIL